MAKRKRLTPANPMFLDDAPAPEAKSALAGPAPIADVARDASASAALEEVTRTLTEARAEGRMVLALPLAQVQLDHLVRDRLVVDSEEMEALKTSIRDRGQQTPVEVVELGPDRYGLISGWRRCHALRALAQETGGARFDVVQALLRRPAEASDAYLAMVEENEIRVGLSYYERARIVLKSVEQGVFDTEQDALRALFRSASRAKRSKIGSFVHIVRALDGWLKFPEALGERAGLALSYALQEDKARRIDLRAALSGTDRPDPAAELACLDAVVSRKKTVNTPQSEPVQAPAAAPQAAAPVPDCSPAPGVTLSTHSDGRLTLSGQGVDAALRGDLLAWLGQHRRQ